MNGLAADATAVWALTSSAIEVRRSYRSAVAIVHVKRVRLFFGARPPGRSPRRTSSVGAAASLAMASRVAPMPS